jgi:hypothetical protein
MPSMHKAFDANNFKNTARVSNISKQQIINNGMLLKKKRLNYFRMSIILIKE